MAISLAQCYVGRRSRDIQGNPAEAIFQSESWKRFVTVGCELARYCRVWDVIAASSLCEISGPASRGSWPVGLPDSAIPGQLAAQRSRALPRFRCEIWLQQDSLGCRGYADPHSTAPVEIAMAHPRWN